MLRRHFRLQDICAIGFSLFRKLFHGWFLFIICTGILIEFLVLLQSGPEAQEVVLQDCRGNAVFTTLFVATLLVIIAGSIDIPKEVENSTILFVLSKPITRQSFVAGKILGVFLGGSAVVGIMFLLNALVLGIRGLGIDITLCLEFLFSIVQVGVISGAVVMFSTMLGELPAIFFSTLYVLLGFFMDLANFFIEYSPLGMSETLIVRLLYYGVPNLTYLQINAHTGTPGTFETILVVIYGLLYLSFFTWFGSKQFAHREFA